MGLEPTTLQANFVYSLPNGQVALICLARAGMYSVAFMHYWLPDLQYYLPRACGQALNASPDIHNYIHLRSSIIEFEILRGLYIIIYTCICTSVYSIAMETGILDHLFPGSRATHSASPAQDSASYDEWLSSEVSM